MTVELLSYAGKLVLLINLIIYWLYLMNISRVHKVFMLYLVYILVIESSFHILRNMKINNLFLTHFYFIGQSIFLNYFYCRLLESREVKRIFTIAILISTVSLIANFVVTSFKIKSFNYFEIFIANFSVIVAMLLYLYDSMEKKRQFNYTTTGLLIYFTSTTTIFLSGNLLIKLNAPYYTQYVWLINAILFVALQFFILYDSVYALKKRFAMKIIDG